MFTSSQVFYHRKQPIITNITYLHWRDAWLLIGFSEMFTKKLNWIPQLWDKSSASSSWKKKSSYENCVTKYVQMSIFINAVLMWGIVYERLNCFPSKIFCRQFWEIKSFMGKVCEAVLKDSSISDDLVLTELACFRKGELFTGLHLKRDSSRWGLNSKHHHTSLIRTKILGSINPYGPLWNAQYHCTSKGFVKTRACVNNMIISTTARWMFSNSFTNVCQMFSVCQRYFAKCLNQRKYGIQTDLVNATWGLGMPPFLLNVFISAIILR